MLSIFGGFVAVLLIARGRHDHVAVRRRFRCGDSGTPLAPRWGLTVIAPCKVISPAISLSVTVPTPSQDAVACSSAVVSASEQSVRSALESVTAVNLVSATATKSN